MTASVPGLAGYLTDLAAQLGYHIDIDQITAGCAGDPALVVDWATTGTSHAGLTYARGLLARPVRFLRAHLAETATRPDLDTSMDADMLAGLQARDRDLAATQGSAEADHRRVLARLGRLDATHLCLAAARPGAVDLTSYLVDLAHQLGYHIDAGEIWVSCGFEPDLTLHWAVHGARHTGIRFTRDLLATAAGPASGGDRYRLAGLRAYDRRLDEASDAAGRSYAALCQALAETGLGMVFPRGHGPTQPT